MAAWSRGKVYEPSKSAKAEAAMTAARPARSLRMNGAVYLINDGSGISRWAVVA
jgi:hypothetical protein